MPQHCIECGAELPGGAWRGDCPRCLLGLGIEEDPPADSTSTAATQRFGDYELIEEIARGGMGVVYKARQVSLDRIVALKRILSGHLAGEAEVKRFRAEAEAGAHLRHPNIVAIYEVGEQEGQHYFTMAHIAGKNLSERMADFGLSLSGGAPERTVLRDRQRVVAALMGKLARAVHFAHEHGVLHRDLKPSNILIDAQGEPHITDFGLAKRLTRDSGLTLTGQALGTPNYMPPEQVSFKRGEVGPRSDVFSLGAVLYHLLTGRPPSWGETIEETFSRVLHEEPAAPRLLNPAVPVDLETICLKCLEKEPPRRFNNAQDLADELDRFLRDEPILSRPVGRAEQLWRWARRNPRVAALTSGVLVSLLAVTVVSTAAALRIAAARDAEQAERLRAQRGETALQRHLYAAQMNLVQQAHEAGNLGRAVELLEAHRPRPGQEDLRGFEWRYLWQLWQSCEKDTLATLRGHEKAVNCVIFSPNGRLLASAGEDATVRIWDVASEKLVASLTGFTHEPRRYSLAFSPDGNALAATDTASVFVWESRTWEPLARLPNVPTQAALRSLAGVLPLSPVVFSPDGAILAAGGERKVKLWETTDWKSTGVITNGLDSFGQLLACADNGRVLVVASAHQVQLWNSRSLARIDGFPGEFRDVKSLAVSPDGRRLVAGNWDGEVKVWDVLNRLELASWKAYPSYIRSFAFSPDGQTLAMAGGDQLVHLWDMASRKEVRTFRGHLREVRSLAFSPDGRALASASVDGTMKLWSVTRRPIEPVQKSRGIPLWFSRRGTNLATVTFDGGVTLWDTRTGQELRRIKLELEGSPQSADISSDGDQIALGMSNGTAQVWHLPTRTRTATLPASDKQIHSVKFSPDARRLATAGWPDGRITVWELAGKTALVVWDQCEAPVAFSPDGNLLAGTRRDFAVKLWDLTTRKELATLEGHDKYLREIEFSPDGKLVATASTDGTAGLWDVATGKAVDVLRGHAEHVLSVSFSPDGKTLATASMDDTIKLWHVASRQEMLTLKEYGQDVGKVLFSPDGGLLAVGHDFNAAGSGTVRLFRAPSLAEIDATVLAGAKTEQVEFPQRFR